MQVDPIQPKLKTPGTKRLKPYYAEPPSKHAFKFNSRRYIEVPRTWFIENGALEVILTLLWAEGKGPNVLPTWFSRPALALLAACARLPEVRRCKLKAVLKAPDFSAGDYDTMNCIFSLLPI